MKHLLLSFFCICVFVSSCGDKERKVLISTNHGDIVVKLYSDTPEHRDNFVKLAQEGFYNDLLFHRVISEFMIQGGDPDSKNAKAGQKLGNGGPGHTLAAEFHPEYFHKKGALAAARQGDQVNPDKRSSGSQFYIVQGKVLTEAELARVAKAKGLTFSEEQIKAYTKIGGTPHLDGGYTVFGEIVKGMKVLDKIAALEVDGNNRPKEDVKMTVKVLK